jgi:hypothetical protein
MHKQTIITMTDLDEEFIKKKKVVYQVDQGIIRREN